MLHWTSKDAIKDSPIASLIIASFLIAGVAGAINLFI